MLLTISPAFAASDYLVRDVTATTTGTAFNNQDPNLARSVFAYMSGTGAVSATVYIEVSQDNINWMTTTSGLCSLSLSGTTTAFDGCAIVSVPWRYVRAKVTAISGTGATLSVYFQ